MKLRNKKTGKVWDIPKMRHPTCQEDDISFFVVQGSVGKLFSYRSIAELNADWEDYKPKEPLIKDEKIRKAVRAWAEADDLDNFRVQNQHFNECKIIGYTAGINKASFIGFQTTIAHADNKKLYTITELCGEDKE